MNRQQKRRAKRKLNISSKEIDNLSKQLARDSEAKNQEIIYRFLGLTYEALKLEFGFGEKRLARYGARLNNLLDSINLDYVSFDDILEEFSIKPRQTVKVDRDLVKRKIKELKNEKS